MKRTGMREVVTDCPSIYADAQHYDVLAQYTAPRDLPFYRQQLERFGGPVLELGSGTGRVALDLAAAGADVTGVDSSAALIRHAARKAKTRDLAVNWVHADFTELSLGRRYGLVIIAYNALNHLLTLPAISACLRGVLAHLAVGGRLIVDTFNPDPAALAVDPECCRIVVQYRDPYRSGALVVLSEQNRYDAKTQVNHIRWRYMIAGVVDARVDELAMRIFFPQELDALLSLHGLLIEQKYGNYDGCPFAERTPKQLLCCTRAPAG